MTWGAAVRIYKSWIQTEVHMCCKPRYSLQLSYVTKQFIIHSSIFHLYHSYIKFRLFTVPSFCIKHNRCSNLWWVWLSYHVSVTKNEESDWLSDMSIKNWTNSENRTKPQHLGFPKTELRAYWISQVWRRKPRPRWRRSRAVRSQGSEHLRIHRAVAPGNRTLVKLVYI